MGIGLGILITAIASLTVTGSLGDRIPAPVTDDIEIIDRVIFELDLLTFIRQRPMLRRAYPQLDWTSDGCSAPIVGESGRSFNFRNACTRHDFGYRNYKIHGIFTTDARTRLDEQFRRDLDTLCAPKVRTFKVRCVAWAEIFFTAVRAAGGP